MAKYKLVNDYGNAIYYAETEQERNELLSRGFHEEVKPKKGKAKSKEAKRNE